MRLGGGPVSFLREGKLRNVLPFFCNINSDGGGGGGKSYNISLIFVSILGWSSVSIPPRSSPHQEKIVRKPRISTVLWLLFDFLSVKNDVSSKNFEKINFLLASWRSKCHGSGALGWRVKWLNPYHGEIDIAGVELHVDLLVDKRLRLLVEVHPDPALGRRHLFAAWSRTWFFFLYSLSGVESLNPLWSCRLVNVLWKFSDWLERRRGVAYIPYLSISPALSLRICVHSTGSECTRSIIKKSGFPRIFTSTALAILIVLLCRHAVEGLYYLEYQSFCPVVSIGSPLPPPTQASVFSPPPWVRGVDTLACGEGGGRTQFRRLDPETLVLYIV